MGAGGNLPTVVHHKKYALGHLVLGEHLLLEELIEYSMSVKVPPIDKRY